MQTRAELRPVARGGVIGLGLGKFVFVGAGVLLMLAANCAAGPENAKVAAGKASIRQRGNTTVIRASDRAIIDYTGFDIARHETVRFIQPGAHASVLNRIHSTRPTNIDGTLKANGHVYLLNPNGILFSGSSVVNTGGLTAAAATMSNRDFLSGNARFTDATGEVVNQGSIVSTGNVALIGRHVANSGVIDVGGDEGVMAMIAGDEVTLTPRGDTISIKVANNPAAPAPGASRAGVENTGRINAGRGKAVLLSGDVYSLAVRNTGSVRARNINIDGGRQGRVEVSGNLDASSRGVGGRGGTVSITGADVALTGAMVDARGARGGGEIRVNDTGAGPTAGRRTTIDNASTLAADATRRGDGGTVLVNSGGSTEFHGRATARGGSVSGDGGFIETSGREAINIDGSTVDAGAATGRLAGSWLIDPTDFTVNAGNVGAITGALDLGMDVTIETGSGGADAGNVTVDAAITKGAGGNATLTLRAENDVTVNQPITSSTGELAVTVQANTAGNGNADANPDAGSFNLSNDGVTTLGAINTNGGAVSIAAADVNLSGAGATITAPGGVTLTANGATDQSLGLGGGPGAFTLTDAEMQQIVSTGAVSFEQLTRTDAVNIGTLTLGAAAYDLSVAGGAMSFGNITMAAGNDLTLISENGAITGTGTLDVPGTVTLRADDLALDAATITTGAGAGRVRLLASAGRTIGLDAAGDLALNNTELNAITTGTLEIGTLDTTGAADVTVGTIAPANIVHLDIITPGRIDEATPDNAPKITLVDNSGVLKLTAGEGIGAQGTPDGTGAGPLDIDARSLDASVSGAGGLFVKGAGTLTVVNAATADGKLSIRSAGDLTLQAVSATEAMPAGGGGAADRTLELVSGGAITSSGTVASNGSAHFESTGAGQDLTITGASVATAAGATVSLKTTGAGADATLANTGATALSGVDVAGDLDVSSGGAITQTDAITAGGAATFTTLNDTGAAITLDDAGNRFGALTARARDAMNAADAAGDIAIAETAAGGNVMDVALVSTTGAARLVGGDIAIDTGTPGAAITAGAGGIRIEPAAAGDAIAVGTGAVGDLRLSTPELHELSSTGGVTIGRGDGTGQVTIGSGTAVDLSMAGYDLTLRGGPIVFANTLTLGADRQLALVGGAISNTNGLATPDYVVSGDGKLLIDSTDAVNMQTAGLRRLAAQTTGNSTDIALTNFGAAEVEITSLSGSGGLGAVSGVSAGTDGNISLIGGGPWRISQGVSTSGTGSVTIQSENVAGDLIDNTGAMGTAVTVGPAGGITLITATGAIRGDMAGDAFKVSTGAAAGNASATLVADASTGIDIANAGTGGLTATLTTLTGQAALATGGSLTTGGTDWSADSFDVSSQGDLTINRQIAADAGDIALSSGGGLVTLGADIDATDGDITISGSDLTIGTGVSVTAAGASGGEVTIARSTDGGINVGGGSFGSVTGITDYLTVDNDELNRITADTLTIGDSVHTMFLRVQNVQDPDAGSGAPTADRAHQSIERLVLLAGGADAAIRFAGDQNSFFKALEARAGAGIEVARDLTTTVGGLTLDADADMADGSPGAFFTPDHDVLTFTGSRLLTTAGAAADGPDVTLRGRRAAGEVGIASDSNLTINSTRDVAVEQSIQVAQTLTIDAERETRITGGGDVRQLAITAAGGATLGGELDIGVGGAVVDADTDEDDAGTFTVSPGTLTLADGASLRVVAADVQIDGAIAGSETSDVRIGRSNEGNIQVGAFTDTDPSDDLLTIDNAELGRITARNLTLGNYAAQGAGDADNDNTNDITVDGVTAAASNNVSGLTTLRAGEDLTFSGGASTFNALTGEAAGEIMVSSDLVTDAAEGGDLTLSADSDDDEAGSLTIGGDIFTRGGNFTGSGGDLVLTGRITTAENSAQGPARGDVLIFSTRDTINVNNAGADDAGRMTITDAEVRNITARNLTIGGNDSTTVNVRDFSAEDGAGINGTTGFISGDTVNLNGTSTFGALDVQARAAVNVNGNLTTTVGDLSINANTNSDDVGQISINGARTLTSAGDLTLSTRNTGSGGVAEGIEAGGVLTLRAADDVQVNSSLTATDGSVTIAADTDADGDGAFGMVNTGSLEVQIGDLRITAADINLPAATSGNGQIRVESGDITIDRSTQGRIVIGGTGAVAGAMTIDSAELRKIQGGTDLTIGGANTSRLDVRALSGADTPRVSGVVNLRALADGGSDNPGVIKFNDAAHSFVALDARARSLVKLDNGGSVSATVGGINFDTTLNSGRIELGGSLSATSGSTAADVNLRDRVLLTRNATLSARRDVHLFSTVDSAQQGGERSLTIDAGRRAIIDADIGRTKRLSGFGTAGPSSSSDTGRVTRLGGDIYTNDGTGIRMRNAVQLTQDVTLQDDGEQGVFFYNTVNGTTAGGQSLTVITDLSQTGTVDNTGRVTDASIPLIVFGGNVGQTTALRSLNLNTGTRLRGNNTTQTVDGHTGVPLVSTIVARRVTTGGTNDGQFVSTLSSADSFAFTTTEGFTMGRNEKLSSAGTVTINAGAARLGDITAFSGIRVNAGSIAVRSRDAGLIAVNGRRNNMPVVLTAPDLGVDFVANDFIDFGRAPTVEGGGPAPTFGTASGQRSNNNLSNFLFRQFTQSGSRIDATTFQTGTGSSLVNLDLTSTGPTDTNFAQSIAGLIPRESRFSDVGQDTTLSQALFTDLTQLGVNPRNLGGDERLANLVGWSTFDDMPESLSSDEPALFTTVNRLPDQMTRQVVRQYRELVTRSVTDPQTGQVTEQSHKAAIKRTFDDAVKRYRSARNQPTGEIEPVSFREYVNRTPVEADARAYADQLADLLRNLELLGLVGRELTLAKQQILRDLRPSGIQTLRNMEIFVRTRTDLPEPEIVEGVVVNN